jgi:phasin family protein
MAATTKPFAELGSQALTAAARMTRISMDSAERVIALQLDFAKANLEQATRTARAYAGAKDVQDLFAVRTRAAEAAMDKLLGYSRGLYEVASEAQNEFSRLAEERMSSFQQAVTESVEQAAKQAPAGDVAATAIKSSLAATTAAFDSFTKAARNVTAYADASVRSHGGRSRK